MKPLHLLFVYNADADVFSALTDFVHKILAPATYHCSLCQLTYGSITMKQQWKSFLLTIAATKTFLHKDEFQKRYGKHYDLPAVFYLKGDQPVVLLSAAAINACTTLDELQNTLLSQLKTVQGIFE